VPGAPLAATAVSLPGRAGGIPKGRPEAGPLRRMVGWLRARLRHWSMQRALERLDDRTLADIGMERPRTIWPALACHPFRPGP
jgi:uncharacterized protein YjiS (DUF1127 family)